MRYFSLISLLALFACGEDLDGDGDGFHELTRDCDDDNPDISPAAIEICDGIDNDCNGEIDELGAKGGTIFYVDLDGDGHGSENGTLEACALPQGYSTSKRDCDESDAMVNPDADEICDGIDNDCDTHVDEYTAVDASTWYPDRDGDGYGETGDGVLGCVAPPDHVLDGSDCDDIDPGVNPEAEESCETPFDDDCDGSLNDEDAFACLLFYADMDGDGFGGSSACLCKTEDPYLFETGGDCNDENAAINPGAEDIIDFIDNDCQDGATIPISEADIHFSLAYDHSYVEQTASGDFNGDGHIDLVIADMSSDDSAHVFYGPHLDHAATEDANVIITDDLDEYFAKYKMLVIDANGDEMDDLILTYYNPDQLWEYRIFMAPFSESHLLSEGEILLTSDISSTYANLNVVGDLNDDGHEDLVWASPYSQIDSIDGFIGTIEETGKVAIFHGPHEPGLQIENADQVFYGELGKDRIGYDTIGGDVDGDGIDELLVGSTSSHTASSLGGAIRIFNEEPSIDQPIPDTHIVSNGFYQRIFYQFGGAGDINGDGHLDVTFASYNSDVIHYNSGRVQVLYGPFSDGVFDIGDLPVTYIYGENENDELECVLVAGDVTGDDKDNLLLGARRHDATQTNRTDLGAVYLTVGALEGHVFLPDSSVKFAAEMRSYMGGCKGTSSGEKQPFIAPGDLNDDGLDDILISARTEGWDDPDDRDQVHLFWGMQE